MRNEKFGKFTKFRDLRLIFQWAVHEKPSGGDSVSPPDSNRVKT